MFGKTMCSVSLMGLCALATLAGCKSGEPADEVTPADAPSMGVIEGDDWFYDDDGSVLLLRETKQLAKDEAVVVAFKSLSIVAIELLPNGKFGAIELKAPQGLEMGSTFTCKSIAINRVTGEAIIDFGNQGEDCCEMLVQTLDGVVRMSCSGNCDNGEDCALETTMAGEITSFTCECPVVP